MRKYCVAFVSFQDNSLRQVICFSMTEVDACIDALIALGHFSDNDRPLYRFKSVEGLNSDLSKGLVSVMPV